MALSHVIPTISSGILNAALILVFNGARARRCICISTCPNRLLPIFFSIIFLLRIRLIPGCSLIVLQLVGFRCWLSPTSKRPYLAGTGTEMSRARPPVFLLFAHPPSTLTRRMSHSQCKLIKRFSHAWLQSLTSFFCASAAYTLSIISP